MSELYAQRRKRLSTLIKAQYPEYTGIIVLFAAYEQARTRFWQDGTFWYFTGIDEPGAICTIDPDGEAILYVPDYVGDRNVWVDSSVTRDAHAAALYGFDAIKPLGEPIAGYGVSKPLPPQSHRYILEIIQNILAQSGKIYVCASSQPQFSPQNEGLDLWQLWIPALVNDTVMIAPIVSRMRRIKSAHELLLLQRAVAITEYAHQRACTYIAPEVSESVVHAALEGEWTARGSRPAFPAIVGSGVRSTVLHYDRNEGVMGDGDVVVIDCGAAVEGYCADISRTYPVSGEFSYRQREIYQWVALVYEYSAAYVQSGWWLCNAAEPLYSLHHRAVAEFKRYGVEQFFVHGIGHFLGLDVHDVGDRNEPLQVGDVITIEPGLYLRDEGIGIRIEDDFVIGETGATCLTTRLPYASDAIEALMQTRDYEY